ncbi:macoilin-1 isoform X1 [Dunckerocampus dactyliophorus]|uniref:macoilin-1 isoform X1 n=2 Tax=Dunckerocampus dactyliophorus TaxID=161453 RepID=UPI0024069DE4|nr:macoilin-1 isoform X1 [Dunckerocampus dactyliophorus]XP_054618165.1 macoilin-1 isoform X1 [Dunckerocampus dactyliophorus]
MKKRYVDASRLRKMKKLKISERLSESAYTFLKFMAMWMLVLLADFILEFRLEYLWPCWLFFGSVYTTFHCHGLVICAVFVCAAFTLDIFCLIFVPLHWLFFVASTYVVFNYIWHTEKGICISTVSLWILLVYTEASLRLKDLKTSHANLSHLFAAHCIGYPVVYMGFDATCYFTNIFKLRIQKAVQSDNDFHMQLLQHSLPPGLPLYPKMATDNGHSKWKSKSESSQYQFHNGAVLAHDDSHTVDCLQIPSEEKLTEKATQEVRSADLNRKPLLSKNCSGESRELVHSGSPGPESSTTTEKLPQEEQGNKATRAVKNSSPKARRTSTATPSPPAGRTEKKQRPNWKTVSPNRDGADKNATAAHNQHAEQLSRLEQEVRKLRGELQVSRHSEQELRSHVCNLTNSERSLRPEVSLLRQSNMLLQSKILCLTKTKQRDKQTSAMLEKKTRAETEARLSAERQLAELQAHKADDAARSLTSRQDNTESQMLRKRVKDLETEYKQLQLECQVKESRVVDLESDVEALGKYRCVEKDADVLLSTLSVLQEKAQHLEYNLSAETRIKLDLFSALGDARRQLEIAQGKLMKQEREISDMKQKIAEVMAVSPAVSYLAPRPAVPQYLTKLLTSERYVLNPRALMYQCLKK